jgi:hypothetical protein
MLLTRIFLQECFFYFVFNFVAMDDKIEHRVCIKFFVKLGKSATQIHEMLREAFEEHSLSQTVIFEWHPR